MRVLYYNWVDPFDSENRGGGVSLYLRNLVTALRNREGVETSCISAGLAHRLLSDAPGWAPVEPGADQGPHRRYELVNSGLLAPAHADYANPAQLSHKPTEAAFADFLARTGPYDVIHFQNLEGVPAAVLAVAAAQPGTRVVLTLHNYYPFCSQVNFWHRESANCTDFADGKNCIHCLPAVPNRRATRMAMATSWQLSRLGAGPGTVAFDRAIWPGLRWLWHRYKRLRGGPAPASQGITHAAIPSPDTIAAEASLDKHARRAGRRKRPGKARKAGSERPSVDPRALAFAERRRQMVALINRHCDTVLCVSDRVREIAIQHGVDPVLVHTGYIGSPQARHWNETKPRASFLDADGTLHMAYLGYMRADKGFPFLMQALAALPDSMLSRLRLTLAARRGSAQMMQAMHALAPRLAGFHHADGYRHDQLDTLLGGVALGVVPVMWEDNLPQVAIEMHARHVALLTSDMGGARELGNCPALVFRAGDSDDFAAALGRVLAGKISPKEYWRRAREPVGMEEHLAALAQIYAPDARLVAAK
ncbi:MAG: glycosyltransferase [Pararhodobacter sp.]|nr:glycosyltransferase [Pararhodobacter sp.]